jgi:hypothetical protein
MRVLCEGEGPLPQGLKRVLDACGIACTLWNPETKPAFDVFDEVEPDLFVYQDLYNRAVQKCLAERDEVVPFPAGAFVEPAVDTFLYFPGTARSELLCDVSYVGRNRRDDLSRFLCRLIAETGLNVKIFSESAWPAAEAVGSVSISTERDIYMSATVSIASGPEHALRITACGGKPLKLYEHSLEPGDIPAMIKGYSTPSGKRYRKKAIEAERDDLYRNYTYWHDAMEMFSLNGPQFLSYRKIVQDKYHEIFGL